MAKFTLIILLICFFTGNLCAEGIVLDSKNLSTAMFNCSDIGWIGVFIDSENNPFIRVTVTSQNPHGIHFLYSNNSWLPLKQYGGLWDVFVKDGYFHMACKKDETISIYKVRKNIELISNISIGSSLNEYLIAYHGDKIIPVLGSDESYYLLTSCWVFPINPREFFIDIVSVGHGKYYNKPLLIEVQDGKPGKPKKLPYGGKRDETYYIKQVAQSGDLVHFLGFRQQEKRAWGSPKEQFTPVLLHHATYDLKKKKVTQTNPIWTDTPRFEKDTEIRYDYRNISIDAMGSNVFVGFSWVKKKSLTNQVEVRYIESNIFYWDCNQGKVSEVEKIADGFLPIVKADSFGNAHLLYVNIKGNLMHRVKRKDIWRKEDVLVDRVDAIPYIDNIAAAFDKYNNLHVVYPLGGNLVYAKIKLDLIPDK